MWSDNESSLDLLGFHHLQAAITSIISDEDLLPTTIGVFGDWGSGKSSLLEMVKADLAGSPGVLVVSFNGWLFENYDDAKSALMGTIIDEVMAHGSSVEETKDKVKRVGWKLLKKVNLMGLLGSAGKAGVALATGGPIVAGLSVAKDIAHAVSQLTAKMEMTAVDLEKVLEDETGQKVRQSIREFRSDFKQLLDEAKIQKLVVIIDDLDRCMPDTIIQTLEAIKLFLFVPSTAFILGADERLVKYAVRRRFPELPGEKAEVGRDYLEKLVQFPVRVPPLGRAEMETYINLLFAKKAKLKSEQFDAARRRVVECAANALLEVRFNLGIAQELWGKLPDGLADDLSVAQRIAPVLAAGLLGNPRQCKRFLNALVLRLDMAMSRGLTLKRRVLAKLMLLEYFRPETFKRLAEVQAEQSGRPAELELAEKLARPKVSTVIEDEESNDGSGGPTKPSVRRTRKVSAPTVRAGALEELPTWLADPALHDWIGSEPSISAEDLRPYFFFSRDTLGPLGGALQRMSPLAQEILTGLFQESEAARGLTLKRALELSNLDAAAVLEALTEKVRQEEDLGAPTSALMRSFDWINARRELFGQMVTLLQGLPEDDLPISVVPKLVQQARTPDTKELVRRLLHHWAQDSSNTRLKAAAQNQLPKIK